MNKSSCVLIFNEKGELLIQVRTKDDKLYPLFWDFSAAGGLEKGESFLNGAKRELKEELGIEIIIKEKESFTFKDELLKVYTGKYDSTDFHLNNEVEKVFFIDINNLHNRIKSGQKAHPQFLYTMNKFFF